MTKRITCRLCKKDRPVDNFGWWYDNNGFKNLNDYCQACKHHAVINAQLQAKNQAKKPKQKPKQKIKRYGKFERLIGGM